MKRIMLSFTAVAATLALLSPVWTAAQDVNVPEKTDGQHTVVKGDTLWDISGRYLKDPFLWPEIWKVNPEIANPHLIYPGDQVALPGLQGKPATPVGGAAAAPETPGVPTDKKVVAAGKISPRKGDSPFEEAPLVDISKTLLLVPEKKEKKVISLDETRKPKIPVATEGAILEAGFIVDDLDNATIIVGSPGGDRLAYSQEDKVYLSHLSDVSVGDYLISVRPEEDVEHPATGRDLGELVKVTGLMQVIEIKDGFPLCKINNSFAEIRATDKVIRYEAPELVYEPVKKNLALKGEWGYIVASMDNKEKNATLYTVYLDLGTDDGVKPGDTFDVVRSGGIVRYKEPGHYYIVDKEHPLPDENIGEVQVISVQDNTSTAKVVSFVETIVPGYRVYYKD